MSQKLLLLAVTLAALACTATPTGQGGDPGGPSQDAFTFGIMADLPYTAENERMLPALLQDIDRSNLAFVVHAGDFTRTRCGDDLMAERLAQFRASAHPVVYTPGDNDWTDCHGATDGKYEPEERLAKIRGMFHTGPETLGQRPFRLERQSEQYPENVRWGHGPALFLSLHMTGSNNNRDRVPEADREYELRNAANLTWMAQGFAEAKRKGYKAVVLVTHANPGFEVKPELRSGYNDFLAGLERETLAFAGPVVIVHADTHYFRVDKPLVGATSKRRIENLTRIEAFGAPDPHWVRVTIDPRDPDLFRVSPVMVEANLIDHGRLETGGFATRNGEFSPPRAR